MYSIYTRGAGYGFEQELVFHNSKCNYKRIKSTRCHSLIKLLLLFFKKVNVGKLLWRRKSNGALQHVPLSEWFFFSKNSQPVRGWRHGLRCKHEKHSRGMHSGKKHAFISMRWFIKGQKHEWSSFPATTFVFLFFFINIWETWRR